MHITPGVYRHYKGQRYRVIGAARHSETMEELVIYRALYGERGLWVRPLAMFTQTIAYGDEHVARFALENADAAVEETTP